MKLDLWTDGSIKELGVKQSFSAFIASEEAEGQHKVLTSLRVDTATLWPKPVGKKSHIAELTACRMGLEYALTVDAKEIVVHTDCQTTMAALRAGQYKCNVSKAVVNLKKKLISEGKTIAVVAHPDGESGYHVCVHNFVKRNIEPGATLKIPEVITISKDVTHTYHLIYKDEILDFNEKIEIEGYFGLPMSGHDAQFVAVFTKRKQFLTVDIVEDRLVFRKPSDKKFV